MRTHFGQVLVFIASAAALTGCGSTYDVSRNAPVVQQLPASAQLSALSRQFRAETPYTIFFDFDIDQLDTEAKSALDIQANWIIAHPDVKFRVYGHADKVGSTAYNLDLGLRRAEAAVAYLMSKGIEEQRLEAMASFGEDAPAINTEDRERANRRVVTEVFGFVTPSQKSPGNDGPLVVSVVINDDFAAPETVTENAEPPADEPSDTGSDEPTSGKNPNSGRGNGDEAGDPGKSGEKNNGGDEI